MSFGEAYQGMTEREILIEVAMEVRHQSERSAAQGIHMEKLEQQVAAIRCPSPRCQDHEHRIDTLERNEDERSEAWGPRTAWIIVALTLVADAVALLALIGVG